MRVLVRTQIREPIQALDHLSLDVEPGEICAVVGPNGAGKTTTFRILIGLTTSTGGTASVLGYNCDRQSVAVRRLVGWMPAEDRSLLMRLTCADNLHFHGRLQGFKGQDLRDRIRRTLNLVGLGKYGDNSVFSLSAGMKSRLQLARALLHDPRVLILDEPTGSVDPVASHELLNLIIGIAEEQGLATLISSHRLEEIEALHSHVILLDRGQVRYDGDLDELRAEWDRLKVELSFRSVESAQSAAKIVAEYRLGTADVGYDGDIGVILDPDVPIGVLLDRLSSHLGDVTSISESRTPLRDILAQMYERDDGGEGTTV